MSKKLDKQKIRVVCIANAFVTRRSIGGGDKFLINLVRFLPKNIDLTIILPHIGYYHCQSAGIKANKVRFIVLPKTLFDGSDKLVALFFAYLIRGFATYFILCKLGPFDILYSTTDIFSDTLPAFFYKYRQPRIKWFARFFHFVQNPSRREGNLYSNIGSYLLQKLSMLFLRSCSVLMIDNSSLKSALTRSGIDPTKIEVHHGGVDTRLINKQRPKKQFSSTAVFIGRMAAHKGIYDALAVWQEVAKKYSKAKLVMIGYLPKNAEDGFKKKIRSLGLEKNIKLVGYLSDPKAIASYCRSSKMMIFLDHEAGFGLAIAESMAAGLPVVAYNLPIFGSVYKSGYLSSAAKDTSGVAKNIVYLLKNPDKLRRLSKEAKIQAQKFDWQIVSRRFYRSFER